MKRRIKSFSIGLVLALSTLSAAATPQYNVNSKISLPGLNLKANTYVLAHRNIDVTGDKIKDDIILVGERDKNSSDIYTFNVNIILKNGKTNVYSKISSGSSPQGYSPQLFVGDFNGDKIPDVMVSMATGGSGGTSLYSIFSFANNKVLTLFKQEKMSEGAHFNVTFKDYYKVNILNQELKKTFIFDYSKRKKDYDAQEIYKAGKLAKNTIGFFDGYSMLQPVDIDKDGVYELKGTQAIWGICHADTLAFAESVWKWNKTRFELKSLTVTPTK